MGKKKKSKNWAMGILVGIILVLGVGFFTGNFSIGNTGSDNASGTTGAVCSTDTTPDLLIKAYDADNVGDAITETSLYRKKGSTTWNSFTTGTAITGLEIGETYEFALGIGTATADQIDNAYGEVFEHTVKCQETETIERAMYNDELEGSVSATFYNKDGDASAQTFSAGDIYTVSLNFKSGKDEYFGNPTIDYPNVLVLKMNQSQAETPVDVFLEDGTSLQRVSVPQSYSGQTTGFTEWAYAVPSIGDRDMRIYLELESDGSNALNVDGTAYLFAGGNYIDEDGEVAVGVEDEDAVAVGSSDPDTVTLDFTA